MAKKNKQAKKMAAAGKSAEQIKAKTGVGNQTAQRYVGKQSPTSPTPTANDQGPAGNTASRTNPGISTSPSRSTPEIKGVGQGLRVAGENGISKSDFKTIAEAKGNDPGKIISKLDKINTKLETKGKAGINLKSGAANMLIRQANKSRSDIFGAARRPFEFGTGRIGQQLSDMSGLNTPNTIPNRMMAGGGWTPKGEAFKPEFLDRGMDLTGRGATGKTVRGIGEQYELPKRFRDEEEVVKQEKDPIEEEEKDPIVEQEKDPIVEEEEDPIENGPEGEVDRSASSGAGGLDLASWATGFKKARSARQKSGSSAQGLASQKKNPFKSWA